MIEACICTAPGPTLRPTANSKRPGVEEPEITDNELSARPEQGHVTAFDSIGELSDVDGPPILNKIGLIVKTRNGIKKAHTILDTAKLR